MNKLKTILVILFSLSTFHFSQNPKKIYTYGGDANYPPFEYLNKDGKPEGFNIDVIRAIAKEMQIDINIVLKEWTNIRKDFEQTNKIDISDMFYSPERDSIADYSIPFKIAYDEIFVRENTNNINSLEDIRDKKVIVQSMSFIYDKLKANYPTAELIIVEHEPEALKKLSDGIGDCAIVSQTVSFEIFKEIDYPKIKKVGPPIFPKEYGFVVKNGNSELLRILNNGLMKLKDKKTIDELNAKWFEPQELDYQKTKKFLQYLLFILAILTLTITGIIFWNRSLKKQVLIHTINLRNTNKKLTDTLENMDEGFFWLDKNWIIKNINEQGSLLFNKTSNEMLNKNFWNQIPQIKEYVLEEYKKAIETQKSSFIEFFVESENSWYENRIVPSENGLALFLKEITEKKKSEELLKESESNLKSLIENWTESIWAIDKNYNYLIFNSAYQKSFFESYFANLEKGMNAINFLPNEDKSFWKSNYDAALSGNKIAFEIYVDKNKQKKYYEVFLNPIIIDEKVKGVSVFRIDITISKNKEIQLIEAKEKAEKSDKLKTEFLAQISHEIRTPINSLLNYTGLLMENCPVSGSEDNKLIYDSIESSSKRILRTIDLILNLSEIQLGAYTAIIKKINLISEVINPIVNEYGYLANKKNILLSFYSENNLLEVNGDKYSIIQIFSNLIDNAIKYTHTGEVKITAKQNEKDEILVAISDTGIGISEEFLPNLFMPFRQEEQGYTRSYEGNGLGLALVKKYCEINNIFISVQSSKSEGTTFYLNFNPN